LTTENLWAASCFFNVVNVARYTDPIAAQLQSIRQKVEAGIAVPQSQFNRVRKAVRRLHTDAVRDINIRSSRNSRHRSYLREPERVSLLERLASFVDATLAELDRLESST
jgi:hypothetical protein